MSKKRIEWNDIPPPFVRWNRLRTIRKNRKIRQIDLMAVVDCGMQALYYLENGLDNRVSDRIKQRVADFLDVPFDEIFPAQMEGDIIIKTGKKITIAKAK